MGRVLLGLLGLLALGAPAPARAEPDAAGCKDYPLISRFPGQHLDRCEERDYDEHRFPVPKTAEVVRGRRLLLHYVLNKGAEKPSALEYIRNYQNALTGGGWQLLLTEEHRLSAKLEKGGREVWLELGYDPGSGNSEFHLVEKGELPMLIEAGKATARPAGAPADVAGAKDYLGVPRLASQRIDRFDEKKFDYYEFSLANGPRRRVEGHKFQLHYVGDKGTHPPSALQMQGNYEKVLAAEGWVVLVSRPGFVTAMLRNNDKETWAELHYDQGSGNGDLFVVEPGEFKQVVSANSLLERLNREGSVTFEVHFDTGKDEIKPESAPVVQQMVEMLKASPALKVQVEGHTDNVGSEKDNLALSERRAKAVMQALVAGGVDAARLAAKGFGQSRPIADNTSEGGRALNRRVVLAKR